MPDDRPATSSAREPSAARNGELAAIQRLLLPPLPAIPGWDFRTHYRPCEEAGGDLYGSQPLPLDRTGFLIADVSGHGVRAAVVMAMVRAWLGSNKVLDRAGRGETPANLNALRLEVEGLGMFVTAVFVSLDPADGTFYYINCGHPSPRVRRADGRVVPLTDGRTIPLGVTDDFSLGPQGLARLDPGDCLVLVTDGIAEARDASGDFFGDDRLDAAVVRFPGGACGGPGGHHQQDATQGADSHVCRAPSATLRGLHPAWEGTPRRASSRRYARSCATRARCACRWRGPSPGCMIDGTMPAGRHATPNDRDRGDDRGGELAAIQRLLLPPLPAIAGWDFRSHYRPCEAAGGDLYGSQPLPDNRTGFVIADVSGHGVRAAVVMAMLRAWLGSNKVLDRAGRGETPANINAMLLEVEGLGMFVTAVFVSLDPADGSFYYINCGHPSPRVRRADGRVVTLTDGKTIPLGVADDFSLNGQGIDRLGPGDCLVLFTDGIPEARSADGDFFDDDRLDAAIGRGRCAGGIIDEVVAALEAFRGGVPQADDECVLVIHRNGPRPG